MIRFAVLSQKIPGSQQRVVRRGRRKGHRGMPLRQKSTQARVVVFELGVVESGAGDGLRHLVPQCIVVFVIVEMDGVPQVHRGSAAADHQEHFTPHCPLGLTLRF